MKGVVRVVVMLTMVMLPVAISGQERISQARFDSLYNKAMGSLTTDFPTSEKCVDLLASYEQKLSPSQKAKFNYLKMKLIRKNEGTAFSTRNKNGAEVEKSENPDTLQYYSRRYLECSLPDKAIPLLMKALEILPVNSGGADHVKIEICEAYREKQEYSKAIGMIIDLLTRQQPLDDKNKAYAWNRMAALYNEWEQPVATYKDSVVRYSRLCMELSEKTNDKPNLAASQNELSYQYILRNEYGKALELSAKAVNNFLASGMPFHAMNTLINQSIVYIRRKDFPQALRVLDKATSLSPLWSNPNLYFRIYNQYASVYSKTGNFREAYEFLLLVNRMQNDFFKDRINLQINELSAKYDLLVKEQKIREEQKKNEFRQRQIILLIIISVVLTIAFIVSLILFRLKKQQSMKQSLFEAVVETENNERRRLARDLHDGLGPVLSAINHYFQAYLDAKPADRETIQIRLQMVISEAIEEVSRISHNISPHVLEKYGLITALNNLLNPFMTNGKYKVSFTVANDQRFDPKIELTVYRCITELLNNTIKHAGAERITLDIGVQEGKLSVRYADDGKGFMPDTGKTEGMGLLNIENRVKSSGGALSVKSTPDTGTIVEIKIPI